ncbi:MAG: hypothetical protein QG639_36 [Patescibacteria group bacterium]|jgi:hypothetical protein|nr:hypothetical protein [Patescibacteria group bacterium]
MNKKIIVPVLTAAMVGAAAFGVSKASAQATDDGSLSIVERLATRFNLNQDEVKAVFEEEHAEREAEMQQRIEDRLDEAVAAGELTEAQKLLILDKHEELRADMELKMGYEWSNFGSMTEEERQAAMEAKREEMETHRAELEAWAAANGIDMKHLMVMGKFHGGGGPGHFKIKFSEDGATADVTETVAE